MSDLSPPSPPPPAARVIDPGQTSPKRAAIIVTVTWLVVIGWIMQQKLAAENLLDGVEASAVQIQQVNGQVTANAVVLLAVGFGISIVVAAWTYARSQD